MEQTNSQEVAQALEDILNRLRKGEPVALFAAVATPDVSDNSHHVKFLMFQQQGPNIGASVALAVGQKAKEVFGVFDKWLKAAGYVPDSPRGHH